MAELPALEQIAIRPATFADYKIIRVYDEFLGDRRLDIQRRELFVADNGDHSAAGFLKITASSFLDRPLVEIVCVAPAQRRQGIATRLLDAACKQYHGCEIYLTTEKSNVIMQQLLDTCGWAQVGSIAGFNIGGELELIYRTGHWI